MQDILLEQKEETEAFEFEGITITDKSKSPCGRFDLTPEQSKELYGK